MGFLTSSFMKSFSLQMKLNAQRRQQSVTLDISRNKRQMESLKSQLKNQKLYLTTENSKELTAYMNQVMQNCGVDEKGMLTEQGYKNYQAQQGSIFMKQQEYQNKKSAIEAMWEQMYEANLQPLQNEEERLQTEMKQADEDYQFWNQTCEAYSKSTSEDLKDVIPNAQG